MLERAQAEARREAIAAQESQAHLAAENQAAAQLIGQHQRHAYDEAAFARRASAYAQSEQTKATVCAQEASDRLKHLQEQKAEVTRVRTKHLRATSEAQGALQQTEQLRRDLAERAAVELDNAKKQLASEAHAYTADWQAQQEAKIRQLTEHEEVLRREYQDQVRKNMEMPKIKEKLPTVPQCYACDAPRTHQCTSCERIGCSSHMCSVNSAVTCRPCYTEKKKDKEREQKAAEDK